MYWHGKPKMKALVKKHDRKQFNNLLKRISRGEKDAFEEFDDYYGRFIFAHAWAVTNSFFLADEITNDVLLKVWTASQKCSEVSNPVGWIYTITINCSIDKVKQEKQYAEIYDIPCNDANLELVESSDAFYKAIAPLKENERKIIIFKTIEKLSFKEIAKIMKEPVSSVSAVFYRALKKIETKNF